MTEQELTTIADSLEITDDDEQALAELLAQSLQTTYSGVCQAEAKKQDANAEFNLTDAAVIAGLVASANSSAASIRLTFNADMRSKVFELGVSVQERASLISALTQWFTDKQEYKSLSITVTEIFKTQHQAVIDFYEKSGFDARFWFGGSLQCPICKGIAAGNPYTYDTARGIPSPVHINCGDILEAEILGPNKAPLWKGN
jgi:hypothetical protein